MSKLKAIITIGVSGCGKTTWANEKSNKGEYYIVSRDDVRFQIHSEQSVTPFQWKTWKWSNEDEVTKRVNLLINDHFLNEANIIIADTNLNKQRMLSLKAKLEGIGYDVELKYFHGRYSEENVSIEQCLKRDSQRFLSVGFDVIHKQWKQMIDSYGDDIIEQYTNDSSKSNAILVDLDGTLALTGDRGIFDWKSVGVDRVNWIVADIVKMNYDKGNYIILMSGRDSICRRETEEWLKKWNIPYNRLYMRAENDNRKDSIVKLELFDRYVRHNFNVLYAIDDRKQVLQLWNDIGLQTLNVGHINEYF